MKGMLMWHSVGTGKTCAAIATATSTFERDGYTILWVTRASIKNEVWKNMFDLVCSDTLKERLATEPGFSIPSDSTKQMHLLSKSWSIRPMSYRQFTNLVAGKNATLQKLQIKNGKVDPLRKTLLIIDEAHKLYGGSDLSSGERPNVALLEKAIDNSYARSGTSSVRLLLMSGTPFTNDPMELIKLINLCKSPESRLPTDFEMFGARYLTKDGLFSEKGKKMYLNDIAGTISYLNQQKDARRFAQYYTETVHVGLSRPSTDFSVIDAQIEAVEKQMNDVKSHSAQKMESLKLQKLRCGRMESCKRKVNNAIALEETILKGHLADLVTEKKQLKLKRKSIEESGEHSQMQYIMKDCVTKKKAIIKKTTLKT
jgi:hypothetical protein